MRKLRKLISGIITALIVLSLVSAGLLIYRNICYQHVIVDGDSMKSTLVDGDYGLMKITSSAKKHIKRFDIVIFKISEDNSDKDYIIKRVIGLPGEVVNISTSTGDLSINGEIVEQNFLDKTQKIKTCPTISDKGCGRDYVVPEDAYYVLGDNRTVSYDSRSRGALEFSKLDGVLKVIYKHCETGEGKKLVCKSIKPKWF